MHLVAQVLHAMIEKVRDDRRLPQALGDPGGNVAVVLVVDLVLEARPEVHRDRADLDLDGDVGGAARADDGHGNDEVQRLVPVLLRVGDVIAFLDEGDVGQAEQEMLDRVHVLHEGARDAHASDVLDVLLDRLGREGDAFTARFGHDARGGLHAGGDRLDGVVAVGVVEILLQNREPGEDLIDRKLIAEHDRGELVVLALHGLWVEPEVLNHSGGLGEGGLDGSAGSLIFVTGRGPGMVGGQCDVFHVISVMGLHVGMRIWRNPEQTLVNLRAGSIRARSNSRVASNLASASSSTVEQVTLNHWVPGSNPGGRTTGPGISTIPGPSLFPVASKNGFPHTFPTH